ncbi:hypothetical protein F5148DRAFT_197344 [Russula earlei]|uniref:Uncharacterized protein n=1 Tax=Russula earlei TaxID=71964 RepID=A0ACC0U4T6_9AGAM|nr:hypothetical protein F5148DRAFT_197344 [Russula earlei]
MKLSVAFTLFLPLLVHAQYPAPTETYPESSPAPASSGTPASSTPTSTPASGTNNINVQVAAGGQLVYNPSNFTASNGTTVTFIFPPGALPHSVTQSTFANPCTPLAATGGNPAGFDSGLQAGKQFTIKITNDQLPVWFFCKNTIHCGLGMVGAINAPTTGNTYTSFVAAAKAIGSGETPVPDNGPVTGGVNAVATATPSPTSASSSSTSSSTPSSPASRVVADGLLAVLAAVFGITMV